MVGSGFPYSEFLPKEGQARGVQVDLDPGMLSVRYPMEVNLQGDVKATLEALLPLLDQKTETGWRDDIASWKGAWAKTLHERAMAAAKPVNPQRPFMELSQRLPEGAILTCDSGSCANWYARDIQVRRGMMCSLSGGLASMGAAVPYAIAAKFAHPDRPVIAMVGDGAMQMSNMAELITVAKYWRRWSDPRWIVMVLNNEDLNQVTWEQRVLAGDPKLEASQVIPSFPYARYAELLGLRGIRVDDPERVGDAWDEALAADRPVVYEAITDPEYPPLPPHIKLDQATSLAKALIKGDPAAGRIMRQSLKGKLHEFVTR
jgi:pyruvate dehydrogenase (quinone)